MYDEYFGKLAEPTRRGFLGSVIGMLASTQLPFTATPAIKNCFDDRLYSRLERMLYLEEEDFLKFKNILHTAEGGHIWMPSMKAWKDNVFTAKDLLIREFVTAYSSTLIDDEGYIISSAYRFNGGQICACNGDTLKLTSTMPDFDTIKQAIKESNFEYMGMQINPKIKALKLHI